MSAGAADRQLDGREDGRRCLLEPGAGRDSWTGGKRWEKMPAGAGRQLNGGEDGRRCLLELVETAGRAGRWEKMPAGAGRQLNGRDEMGEDATPPAAGSW